MSRVYEALRQSELERGASLKLLDPESFQSPADEVQRLPASGSEELAWEQIASVRPLVREESRLVALTDERSLGAEKFRLLRARLRHIREQQPLKKIVVTSAVPEEGKTSVSMNLAVSLSKHTTEKVLLLEGDLRRPKLAVHLGMQGFRGIAELCASQEPFSRFIYRMQDLPLYVLPAGKDHDNPLAVLQSPRFLQLYEQLSRSFDWILIDAPPLLPMADVSVWSRQADGLLLVVREGRTPKTVLQKGLETLDNPNVIGVVFNDAHETERSYYSHYYGKGKLPVK